MNTLQILPLCFISWLSMHAATVLELGEGGPESWTTGLDYSIVFARQNDTLVFRYDMGQHNVVEVQGPSCNFTGSQQVAGLTDSPFTLHLPHAGTFYYACSVPSHCEVGMLITISVSGTGAGPPIGSNTGATERVSAQPTIQGIGSCTPPVPIGGGNDTFNVSCLSPAVSLKPGEIRNEFIALESPYPERMVAVLHESAQMVDSTGRPAPESEVYLHHIFGSSAFFDDEGAEARGSMTLPPPLADPYYHIVSGTDAANVVTRLINIHLINSKGVPAYNMAPCIECWCRDPANWAQGYYGGTACCTSANCLTPLANEPPLYYQLQYNVTYKYADAVPEAIPVHKQLLDVMNGNVEYDVHRQLPECIELFDALNGTLICSSCATYGNSGSVDVPGQENGYVVRLEPDILSPPYPLAPGHNVTVVSRYDASVDHYGVMGFMYVWLSGWDPSCPGKGPVAPPSKDVGGIQENLFQIYAGE